MIRLLQDTIYACRDQISKAEVVNKQKSEYAEEMVRCADDYKKLSDTLKNITKLSDICQTYAVKYHDMRIAELEKRCEAILELAFPEENFGVSIRSSVVRKKEVSYLVVGPKNKPISQWFPPVSENGGLVKQLLGASVIESICEMVGADYIFFDEMFCSGDPVTVADINPFFKGIIEKGIQLMIIEHKPTLYEGLERREIHLGKDRSKAEAVRILHIQDKVPEVFSE